MREFTATVKFSFGTESSKTKEATKDNPQKAAKAIGIVACVLLVCGAVSVFVMRTYFGSWPELYIGINLSFLNFLRTPLGFVVASGY